LKQAITSSLTAPGPGGFGTLYGSPPRPGIISGHP
jgi:hypothetical protein